MIAPRKTTSLRSTFVCLLCFLVIACSGEHLPKANEERDESFRQWALPDRLREISGLALTSDERLLAVTDEVAVVYELDYQTGKLLKSFALGNPTLRGDFEGITVMRGSIWLMTSDGSLYRSKEGNNGERVEYDHYDTGLAKRCEFEGLASVDRSDSLFLLCKEARKKEKLRLYEWNAAVGIMSNLALPTGDIEDAIERKKVHPSAIAEDPASGNWIIAAARQHAIVELSRDGDLINVIMRLDPGRHRQAEGIAITRDGRLLVSDEAGKGRARLAVYQMEDRE